MIEAEEGRTAPSWRPRCRRDSAATATWRPEAAAWAKEQRPESSGYSANEQEERKTSGEIYTNYGMGNGMAIRGRRLQRERTGRENDQRCDFNVMAAGESGMGLQWRLQGRPQGQQERCMERWNF